MSKIRRIYTETRFIPFRYSGVDYNGYLTLDVFFAKECSKHPAIGFYVLDYVSQSGDLEIELICRDKAGLNHAPSFVDIEMNWIVKRAMVSYQRLIEISETEFPEEHKKMKEEDAEPQVN